MEKLTPFAYLAKNLNKVTFICPSIIEKAFFPHNPLLKDEYVNAVKQMLTTLDAYFVAHKLYGLQDYHKMVKDMLVYPYLVFGIDDESYFHCKYLAYHIRKTRGKVSNLINITSQILNNGKVTEANIMFQFILMLILGPKQLEFNDNRNLTYLSLPRYERTAKAFSDEGFMKVFKNKVKKGYTKKNSILPKRYFGYNFLALGMTELFVRKILNNNEGTTMFAPHVKMVEYLNLVQGETIKDEELLKGKLIHYHLGRETAYDEFWNILERFQITYFSNPLQNYQYNEFFIDATDFALVKLIEVNMQSSPKMFLESLSKIIYYYPSNRKIDLNLISRLILKYIEKHSVNNESNKDILILMQNTLELIIDQISEYDLDKETKINYNISKIRFF